MNKNFVNYLLLVLLFILANLFINKIIISNEIVISSLIERFTINQIQEIIEIQKKWQWISYIFIPVKILVELSLVTSVLYFGVLYFSKVVVTFGQLFSIVIKAEYIFFIAYIFKIFWFYFFQNKFVLEDIQNFYPLSAINIIGYKNLEAWFIYPLQILNLFEVIYIIYLAYQIGYLTRSNPDFGIMIVLWSYLSSLILWVIFVMFIILSLS